MGAGKFPELIVQEWVSKDPSWEALKESGQIEPPTPAPVFRYCPLCYECFLAHPGSDSELTNHIARVHGKEHIYLTVDGVVVRDSCWLSKLIRKCELVLLNVPELEVQIQAGGKEIARFRTSKTCSLTRLLSPTKSFEGKITISVMGGPRKREYTIYRGKQPEFRSVELDKAIQEIPNSLMAKTSLDLANFYEVHQQLGTNELEQRYLKGMVEYYHSLLLEKQGHTVGVRDRIEAAMELLLPFRTKSANAARWALALRMNCFSSLKSCPEGTYFAQARSFFYDAAEKLTETPAVESSILVNPLTEELLSALRAYYGGDSMEVLAYTSGIFRRAKQLDANDEIKLTLLEARTHRRDGNRERAREVYSRLVHHHLFGPEADKFVRHS